MTPRPRLLAALDEAAGPALLAAPAGFGKTGLLREWADSWSAASPNRRIIWITAPEVRDRGGVWPAVFAGLLSAPALPVADLELLSRPANTPEATLSRLAASLAGYRICLIFDGTDGLSKTERRMWLPALLQAPGLRVIVATRNAADVDATATRLTGPLLELAAGDLAFSPEETAAVAARLAPGADPRAVNRIHRLCGGWPACVVLMLRSRHGARRLHRGLPAPERWKTTFEYLDKAVLPAMTPPEAAVLQGTCICRQVEAVQAASLSGRADAAGILAGLAGRGLAEFSDAGRFQVRTVLRKRYLDTMQRMDPAELRRLHGLAADWHGTAGDPQAALRHAVAAGGAGRVAAVLEADGAAQIDSGEAGSVLGALSLLTDTEVTPNPRLDLIAALAHIEVLEPVTAARYLRAAERSWPSAPTGNLRELRALVQARLVWFTPDWAAVSDNGCLLRVPAETDPATGAGMPGAAAALAGSLFTAPERTAAAALVDAGEAGNSYLEGKILLGQAVGLTLQGQLHRAGLSLRSAEDKLPAVFGRHGPWRSVEALLQAVHALLRFEPVSALELTAEARAALGQLEFSAGGIGSVMRSAAALLDGCAHLDAGGGYLALEDLRRVRNILDPDTPFAGMLSAWTAVTEYTAALALGHAKRAREILGWAAEILPGTGELCLLRASGLAASGRSAAAAERLRPVHDGTAVFLLAWTEIQLSILECSMALRAGRRPLAVEHLGRALHRADELAVLRPLAVAPAEVSELLAERAGVGGPEGQTAQRVLALRPAAAGVQPLTPRQHEILALLPSHLSLGQVASELQVSVNTVKTHVRIIYTKLDVTSRHDAVATAYRHGYLP